MIALLYIPFAIFRAWIDAKRIKSGKHIYHGLNGGITIAIAALFWWLADWKAGFAILFIHKVFFDTALNYFRGLGIDYVSPEVKSYPDIRMAFQKGKVIDYIEYRIFGNSSVVPKILYCLFIIVLLAA